MPSTPANKKFRCTLCSAILPDRSALERHVARHLQCTVCFQRFSGKKTLRAHCRETCHCFCRDCSRHFADAKTHLVHVRSVPHSIYYECCDCGRRYTSQGDLSNHCCICDLVFRSKKKLEKHLAAKGHQPGVAVMRARAKVKKRHSCQTCAAKFRLKSAVRDHTKAKHRISCPASAACKKTFPAPSALFSHLESGSCISGVTRDKMNALVFAHDENRYITKAGSSSPGFVAHNDSLSTGPLQELILPPELNDEGPDDWSSERAVLCSQPGLDDTLSEWSMCDGLRSSSESVVLSEWSLADEVNKANEIGDGCTLINESDPVTDEQGTGAHRQKSPSNALCPLCPPDRKAFLNAKALDAHMASAAHAPKVFHCPMAFACSLSDADLKTKKKKQKHFSTLSGLAQHVESGTCQGGKATFKKAIGYVEKLLGEFGFGGFKLLLD